MRWVKSKRAVDLYTLINGRYYSDIKWASLCQITGYLTFCLTAYLGYQLENIKFMYYWPLVRGHPVVIYIITSQWVVNAERFLGGLRNSFYRYIPFDAFYRCPNRSAPQYMSYVTLLLGATIYASTLMTSLSPYLQSRCWLTHTRVHMNKYTVKIVKKVIIDQPLQ